MGTLALMVLISFGIIHAGYGFDETFRRLGDYEFYSASLGGARATDTEPTPRNRFRGTILGSLPVPFPRAFLQGIDLQKRDFEVGLMSYLCGQWKSSGWWYYYFVALAVKQPIGVLGLFALACSLVRCRHTHVVLSANDLAPWIPVLGLLLLLSSQDGFSVHSRYVIPALPFAFIWCSRSFVVETGHTSVVVLRTVFLLLAVASSIRVFPHSMSYFNEFVGGPAFGAEYLLDSNISWGQDLLYLRDWLRRHPNVGRIRLAAFSPLNARYFGIDYELPPAGPARPGTPCGTVHTEIGPQPGWYAIDVNYLHGSPMPLITQDGEQKLVHGNCDFRYFQSFKPVERIGYSFLVYHVSAADANEARGRLGIPELKEL